MDSTTFIAISLCVCSAWMYKTRQKSITQAFLLIHSLYLIYTILVEPPTNVFSDLGVPPDTSTDTLRTIYLSMSPTGDITPELDTVLKKLNSFDIRRWYLQLGHNAIAGCDYCHSFEEFASFAFVRPIFGYILEIAFIGALTLPGTPKAHLRPLGIGILILSLLSQVFFTLTARIVLSPHSEQNPLITNWHDTLSLLRSVLFLVLPLSLHLPRLPLVDTIPTLSSFLPTPEPRLNMPPPAQRLQSMQYTLEQLITRLHLLTYMRAAIMRTPSARERAASWWDVEEKEGRAALADDGVVRTAKGMGLAYDQPQSSLRHRVKESLVSILKGALPSEHWMKTEEAAK